MAQNPFSQFSPPKPASPVSGNPFAQFSPAGAPAAAPETEDDFSSVGLFGRGVAHGVMGMGESVGIGLDWIGAEGLGGQVEDYFSAKREGLAPPEHIRGSVFEDPGLMADLDWWAFNVGSIFPTLAASIVPGVGAAKGVQYGAKALGYLKSGDLAAKMHRLGKASQFAGATVGGLAGGALEGTQTYREIHDKAIESGASEEEARAAASSGGLQMIAASGILNAASVGQFLKTLPDTTKGRLAARTVRGLTEGITEWLEGPAEAGIMMGQNVMTPEEAVQKTVDELNVLGPAFVVGFLMPGAGRIPSMEVPKTPDQAAAQKGVQEQAEAAGIAPDRLAQIEAQTQRDKEDLAALERGEPIPAPGSVEDRDRTLKQESRAQVGALEGELGTPEAQPTIEVLPAPSAATHLRTQGRGVPGSVLGMGASGAESIPIAPTPEVVDEETARGATPTGPPLERAAGAEPFTAVPSATKAEVAVPPAEAQTEAAPSPTAGEVVAPEPVRPEPVTGAKLPRGKSELDVAAAEAAPEKASEAQIEAGTYKKGHQRMGGLDVSIENRAGSKRRPEWPTLKSHYGYFRGTEGKDGDHVDAFIKPKTDPATIDGTTVFVVDQAMADGATFDEHKAMVGFDTLEEARAAYLENYTKGWKGLKAITPASWDEFTTWLDKPRLTKKEFAPQAPAATPTEQPPVDMATVLASPKGEFRAYVEARGRKWPVKPSEGGAVLAEEFKQAKKAHETGVGKPPSPPVSARAVPPKPARERLEEKRAPKPEPKSRSPKLIKMPPKKADVSEAGETATIVETADRAIARVDKKLRALYQLKGCLAS